MLDHDKQKGEDLDFRGVALNVFSTAPATPGYPSTTANPKSMLQLAEEAESKRGEEDLSLSLAAAPPVSDGMLTVEGRARTPKDPNNFTGAKPTGRSSRALNSRTAGKRNGKHSKTEVTEGSHTESDGKDLQSDEDDSEATQHTNKGRQTEKAPVNSLKRKRKDSAPATPAPPTTRVLRPRAPKSAEKIRAEREAEEAFRDAVAE